VKAASEPGPSAQQRLRRIEGRHNPLVKQLRLAFSRAELTETGDCAIEGLRILEEAIRSGLRFSAVFFRDSARDRAERLLPQIGAQVETLLLPDKLFDSLVPSESPQGVAALVRLKNFRSRTLANACSRSNHCPRRPSGSRQPRHHSPLFRSLRQRRHRLGEGTVSPFNSKVVRASAGSVFRLPIIHITENPDSKARRVSEMLRAQDVRLIATSSHKGTPLDQADLKRPAAIFFGNEGSGLPRDLMAKMDESIAIPHAAASRIAKRRRRRQHRAVRSRKAKKVNCISPAEDPQRLLVVDTDLPAQSSLALFSVSLCLCGEMDLSMGLFQPIPHPAADRTRPLADRMRPRTLEEYAGQEHLIGPGKPLRTQIERDDTGSLIFWGPPGTGKTTLAKIIANMTKAEFIEFSAVLAGIKEIKQVMADAERARQYGTRTIVFIDEIHRFNKAQQDAFLPHVEKGNIRLIGATTENPSFEINGALLSRTRVYVLQPLTEDQIVQLLNAPSPTKNAASAR
jgi:tRNA G18 (ribose-2'-O)-methylase SpoU